MIIVYDFKITAEDSEKSKDGNELFRDYFAVYLKTYISDKFKPDLKTGINFDVKIIKKSVDLRQKEQKNVFKAVIKFNFITANGVGAGFIGGVNSAINSISGDFEADFVGFLTGNGIKSRKANSEEEALFHEESADILKLTENERKNIFKRIKLPIHIIGMGPAGIFAAAHLLKKGIKPVLIEKGKCVENRAADVRNLLNRGEFNKKSNVVFGEGGAGTFSDGKLTTRKNDPTVAYILDFLVKMGAKDDILTEHKPHLGSDNLILILKKIREYLILNGAEIYFEEELKDFEVNEKGAVCSIKTDKRSFETAGFILASGSNSYDTYELMSAKGVCMERKPFAAGFRIEHKRDFIDSLFFKGNVSKANANANAKFKGVYYNISSKEFGGYSFCMCPGGVVINSSSGENLLCVNGMSYSGRDMENSNSAVVAAVRPEMLDAIDQKRYSSVTGALQFRKDLEAKAFEAGGGLFSAPYQYTADYIRDVAVSASEAADSDTKINLNIKFDIKNINNSINAIMPQPSYKPSVNYYNLFKLLPDFLNASIAGSLIEFENKFKGFAVKSVLTGLETGTSSAVRIKRNADFESVSLKGLYPCGEGSGYSGGIITSAIDGIKCADAFAIKRNY
jgi:hypothetical protein